MFTPRIIWLLEREKLGQGKPNQTNFRISFVAISPPLANFITFLYSSNTKYQSLFLCLQRAEQVLFSCKNIININITSHYTCCRCFLLVFAHSSTMHVTRCLSSSSFFTPLSQRFIVTKSKTHCDVLWCQWCDHDDDRCMTLLLFCPLSFTVPSFQPLHPLAYINNQHDSDVCNVMKLASSLELQLQLQAFSFSLSLK